MKGNIEYQMWKYFKNHNMTEFESKDVENWLSERSCGKLLSNFDISPTVRRTIKILEEARYIQKIDKDRWRLL